ncbi:PHB depolymerase family esterase [Asticcacaulis sp. 201]|uniref:extracellular catalytic domain type 1 short-chain-length polyhydroxyalkanoate depolymerase n=1 Tax=Asticcacaulis sp. 201 TaxID=3028787 RepID=UPI00291640B0|nr:PHB depolymerase family esterase [Asticcacaulis sp. 201]MDV6330853.1 PHB depolymerase family esterase [Asticcacaulis sp. 201]
MKMNIDMAEVTRLTRLGKLTEAMAVLRGHGGPKVGAGNMTMTAEIEMRQTADGAWSDASDAASPPQPDRAPPPVKPRIDLKDLVGKFRAPLQAGAHGRNRPPMPPGAHFSEHTFGQGYTARRYKLYVPSRRAGGQPALVVMLHGCTQSPDDFAIGTGMNDLAERNGFLVLYPEQSAAANMNRCWNWFNDTDQRRDHGEPALLVGMIRHIIGVHAIDPQKVFVAGLSAGGAMAAILGARYPEVFSGVGVHSGLAVGAAHDMTSAFGAMSQGGSQSGVLAGVGRVPTIVFHGDRDGTVNSRNGDQVVAQVVNGRALTRTTTSGQAVSGRGYDQTLYSDPNGTTVVEHWVIHGVGHAWSGGHPEGSYTDARGPSASEEMVRFFLQDRGL